MPHAALSVSSSTGKLDGEAFSHKVGSICIVQSRVSLEQSERRQSIGGEERWRSGKDGRAMDIRKAVHGEEERAIGQYNRSCGNSILGARLRRTWNDVASVHSILILDESETVHKLHFGNLSGAVGRKVSLDIGLGS